MAGSETELTPALLPFTGALWVRFRHKHRSKNDDHNTKGSFSSLSRVVPAEKQRRTNTCLQHGATMLAGDNAEKHLPRPDVRKRSTAHRIEDIGRDLHESPERRYRGSRANLEGQRLPHTRPKVKRLKHLSNSGPQVEVQSSSSSRTHRSVANVRVCFRGASQEGRPLGPNLGRVWAGPTT